MKQFLFVISLAVSFISCNNGNSSSSGQTSASGPDTIFTPAIYFYPGNGELKTDYVQRIIKDTLAYKSIDTKIAEKTLMKDTSYYVPAFDSVRNAQGRAIPDSTGVYRVRFIGFYPLPKTSILKDFNVNIWNYVKKQ